MARLQVNLDSPLPAEVSVGGGTALFVAGTCFAPDAEITDLHLTVDGAQQSVAAHGMPRLDHFRALHPGLDPYATGAVKADPESADDPLLLGYRSGFWGVARLEPKPAGEAYEIGLVGRTAEGDARNFKLGSVAVAEATSPVEIETPAGAGGQLVGICMATHDPPTELFRRQIDSIRAQTHSNWVCLVSDDCSRPERVDAIHQVLDGDPRFVLSRSTKRLGFYSNFERALSLAPASCEYVAMADQDDFWYPEKLDRLLRGLGPAQLCYSDARIVGAEGNEIAPSYWEHRRNNHSDLTSLLVANSVTGAASLFRREVLDYALPFPPGQFAHYHDHWIGLVALSLGGIEFIPRALYDYVQHGSAALGHAQATRVTRFRERLSRVRADPRERVRVNRARYFVDVMRLTVFATILQMRCGPRLSAEHSRALERFLSLDDSGLALASLGWRAARELSGPPETLGAEWELLQALVWRRLLSATARRRPSRRFRLDAVPPPDLAPRVGRRPPSAEGPRSISEKVAPLHLAVSEAAPRRVNVLIPTIDLEHFFGGYIAKFNLAYRLSARGTRVRLVTVDPVGPLARSWRTTVESYDGLAGMFDRVELAIGRRSGPLEVSRSDAFVATTWWTAHIANAAAMELGTPGFVYLIQEYEPFTFPMGSYAALAEESYRFPHFALFSTELLRGYFRGHAIGAYSEGDTWGDACSASFQNAITSIEPPTTAELAARDGRRLLFYARPEPHAARNMFEVGILALQRAWDEGFFREGWQLHGIGTVSRRGRISLGAGGELELLPRSPQAAYAELLRDHDVGLALMYTPHPSLVPIEMASAGLATATNTFENKTPDALSDISPNLIAGEPTVDGIAKALGTAAQAAEDFERRVNGSTVAWSRDWTDSFNDGLLDRVESYFAR